MRPLILIRYLNADRGEVTPRARKHWISIIMYLEDVFRTHKQALLGTPIGRDVGGNRENIPIEKNQITADTAECIQDYTKIKRSGYDPAVPR